MLPAKNFTYHKAISWVLRFVPFAKQLHRFRIFLIAENEFRLFPLTKAGARFREKRQRAAEKYMRDTAPAKYHDILVPEFEIGCKVRMFPL